MKRITAFIPDAITSMNLLCGVIGVVFACKGRFDVAFMLVLAAAVCDFFDGFTARLLHAYSELGKQLDSLADVVSFGVLPSVMLYSLMNTYHFTPSWFCYFPLLIAVFSGIRLAKFNIDERQKLSFIGLPTPACAMICSSLVYFTAMTPVSFLSVWFTRPVFVLLLTVVLCYLLVCEIPMFSMKGIGKGGVEDKKRITFAVNVVLIVAIVAVMGINWSMTVLLSFVVYVLMNLVYRFIF